MQPNQPPAGGPSTPRSADGSVLAGVGLVILTVLAGFVLVLTHDDEGSATATTAGAAGSTQVGSAGVGAPPTVPAGSGTEPGAASTVPTNTVPPAVAAPHDCIAVSTGGDFLGTGSCAEGGAPYVVTEVLDSAGGCADPDNAWINDGYHVLCLELNLVENYCYAFPPEGSTGFITSADACEAPGTVAIVDIVPGATDDSGCTNQFQWNRWYAFTSPLMVACVMQY